MIKKAAATLVLALGACDSTGASVPEGFQGIVEYEERTLAFEVAGRIIELNVDEGATLEPGDVVGRLDDRLQKVGRKVEDARAAAADARVALLEAGSRPEDIKALKAAVRAAKSNEALADKTLTREQSLAEQGIGRNADLDAASSAASTARARRQELEQQLMRARRGARAEEVDVAEAEAHVARAAVEAADERIARHVLKSQHAGDVLEVHHEEGEFVMPGAPLVTMAEISRPYVDVFVPQGAPDMPAIGDVASVRVDAVHESFPGAVTYIGRRTEFTPKFLFSDRERPNLVLRVRVEIDDPAHELRAGVPAFATFEAPE
jgi:HlyD family secretion protein